MKDTVAEGAAMTAPSVTFREGQVISRIEVRTNAVAWLNPDKQSGPIDVYFSHGASSHTVYLKASLSDIMYGIIHDRSRSGPVACDSVKIAFMDVNGQPLSKPTTVGEYKAWLPFLGYNHKL